MLADRNPTPLCPLPRGGPGPGSRRILIVGRVAPGVVPPAEGGFEGWRTVDGARFAAMDGDGDERDGATPLVWMPGGMGRLTFVAAGELTGGAAAVTVGAMVKTAMGCPEAAQIRCQMRSQMPGSCVSSRLRSHPGGAQRA